MISDWLCEIVNPVIEGQDKYASDFEKFAVRASTSESPRVEKLENEVAVERFIQESACRPGQIRLLDYEIRSIQPGYRAFTMATFRKILQKFHLPATYQQVRTYSNASGAILTFSDRTVDGLIKRRGFMIRPPYSIHEVKSNWSLAFSWDARTCEVTGLFDGVSDIDLKFLQGYMLHRPEFLGHPLFLHIILLEALCQFFVHRRNIHQRGLYELEVHLGFTRCYQSRRAEGTSRDMPRLERGALKCNLLRTSLVYFERRLVFLKSLAEEVDKQLHSPERLAVDPSQQPRLAAAGLCFAEVVANCRSFVDNQIHLCLCLQKRAQGLNDMIYILLAQRDSRATLDLSIAAKADSSAMRAISVVTMFFLPGTFLASLFGMNFFQFDASQSALTAAENIWIFFAVTIPLTLVVMVLGYMSLMSAPQKPTFGLKRPLESSMELKMLPGDEMNEADFKLPSLEKEMAAGPFHSRPPQPILGIDFEGNYVTIPYLRVPT